MMLESPRLRRFLRLSPELWYALAHAAIACGWQPKGTLCPRFARGLDGLTWSGSYYLCAFQRILPDDALAFSDALERAAVRIEAGEPGEEVPQDGRFLPKRHPQSLSVRPLALLRGQAEKVRTLAAFLREAVADGESEILMPPPFGTGSAVAYSSPCGSAIRG